MSIHRFTAFHHEYHPDAWREWYTCQAQHLYLEVLFAILQNGASQDLLTSLIERENELERLLRESHAAAWVRELRNERKRVRRYQPADRPVVQKILSRIRRVFYERHSVREAGRKIEAAEAVFRQWSEGGHPEKWEEFLRLCNSAKSELKIPWGHEWSSTKINTWVTVIGTLVGILGVLFAVYF